MAYRPRPRDHPERDPLLAGGGQQQQAQARRLDTHGLSIDERIAAEKRREAEAIEEGVGDVAECYAELNKLVHEQGEDVDKAEGNVGQARVDVQKGHEQLQSANKYAKSSRKWMICICILVIIIGAILAIVISVTKK